MGIEEQDQQGKLLTDTKGRIIFLPNLNLAQDKYQENLSGMIESGSLQKVLPDLLLDYTSRGIEEKQIEIGGVAYYANFEDEHGAGSIYLKPVEDLSQPQVTILPDQYGTGVKKVVLRSEKQFSSGNPPLEVFSREMYKGNDLVKEHKTVHLRIPKGQITFGIPETDEGEFDFIRVSIREHAEQGTTVTMSLGKQETDSGTENELPLILLIQVNKNYLNDYGLEEKQINPEATYMESQKSSTFTSVKPGTRQYEVTKNLALAIAEEVMGKKMIDLTQADEISLTEDLFGPGIGE